MAEVAASHVSGEAGARFDGADMSTKLKLMGVDVASVGDALGKTAGALDYVYTDPVQGIYKKLVVSGDGKQLLGAILVGDAAEYGALLQATLNAIPLPDHPEDLILPAREGGASKGMGVDAFPATALICSCNNVSKGGLCDAIAAGATSLGALKKDTKAATSVRRLRADGEANSRQRTQEAGRRCEKPLVRALSVLAPGVVSSHAHRQPEDF
jgi:nitrite reductase (NADH) large subunit